MTSSAHIFKILGIVVEFMDADDHSEEEAYAYVKHIASLPHYKDRLDSIEHIYISFEEDEAVLEVVLESRPFERIRRITGYLVGSTDRWNYGKNKELNDRLMHPTE